MRKKSRWAKGKGKPWCVYKGGKEVLCYSKRTDALSMYKHLRNQIKIRHGRKPTL